MDGIPGQNMKRPRGKAFLRHFLVTVNGDYYDPSYGLTYESPESFEEKALFGYGTLNPYRQEDNEFLVRKHKQAGEVIFDKNSSATPLCGFEGKVK